MNIQKKLSLNKHPGDCVPYSLVAAKNVKVSNDDRMIVNEEGLEDCKSILIVLRGTSIEASLSAIATIR